MENKIEIVKPLEPDPATRGNHCVPVVVKNPVHTVINNPLEAGKTYSLIVDGLGNIEANCRKRHNHWAQLRQSDGKQYWINTLMIQAITSGDPL